MRSADALTILEELGASQWGLVTTGQAESYGVSRVDLGRLHDNGMIHRMRRGVYSLPSASYGPTQDLRAAWLATDPRTTTEARVEQGVDVVASHASAAAVHGLGDLIPFTHEFTSTRRRQSTHEDLRFHRGKLTETERALIDGLPVTSVLRTLEDLASASTDLDHLADLVRDALAKPDVHPDALASRLDHLASRYGHNSGQALIDDCLDRAGLPTVATNFVASNALATVLANQLPNQTAFLDSIVRQAMSPEFKAAINHALNPIIFEQMRQLTAQNNPALRAMQDQIAETTRKSFAPLAEARAQMMRPMLETIQRAAGSSLRGPQAGRYWSPDQKQADDTDSPNGKGSSAQEEDPQT